MLSVIICFVCTYAMSSTVIPDLILIVLCAGAAAGLTFKPKEAKIYDFVDLANMKEFSHLLLFEFELKIRNFLEDATSMIERLIIIGLDIVSRTKCVDFFK